MQFFYIDYMNGDQKERNVGFLRVERKGVCIGLRGVPSQCGKSCSVFAVGGAGERRCLGDIAIENGYGMKTLDWGESKGFERCVRIEIPFYGCRKGVCVLRENSAPPQEERAAAPLKASVSEPHNLPQEEGRVCDLPEKLPEDKWAQLLETYPQVHIYPEAQSVLIKPKDLVVLTQRYHSLISNSFVLHSYYNYRQLLLFRFEERQMPEREIRAADKETPAAEYYLGVPGVYFEREKRISQMFGFEGFDIGEARMCEPGKREIYEGCFGYYMKRVEI